MFAEKYRRAYDEVTPSQQIVSAVLRQAEEAQGAPPRRRRPCPSQRLPQRTHPVRNRLLHTARHHMIRPEAGRGSAGSASPEAQGEDMDNGCCGRGVSERLPQRTHPVRNRLLHTARHHMIRPSPNTLPGAAVRIQEIIGADFIESGQRYYCIGRYLTDAVFVIGIGLLGNTKVGGDFPLCQIVVFPQVT